MLLILAKGELTNRGIELIYIEQKALTQLTKTKQNNRVFEIEKYAQVRIGIYNINGLKVNRYRAQELHDIGKELELNIIGVVETNVAEKEGKFIEFREKGYHTFWTDAEKDKWKGSGVAIWVDNQ